MLDKLKNIKDRYDLISEKLVSPEVLNDNKNDYTKNLLDMFSALLGKRASFFDRALSRSLCMNQLLDECIDVLQGKHPDNEKQILKDMRTATRPIRKEQDREIEGNKTLVATRLEKEQGKAKTIQKKKDVEKIAEPIGKFKGKDVERETVDEITALKGGINRKGNEAEIGGGPARRASQSPKEKDSEIVGHNFGQPTPKAGGAGNSTKKDIETER